VYGLLLMLGYLGFDGFTSTFQVGCEVWGLPRTVKACQPTHGPCLSSLDSAGQDVQGVPDVDLQPDPVHNTLLIPAVHIWWVWVAHAHHTHRLLLLAG
jgi:hypothetical protein